MRLAPAFPLAVVVALVMATLFPLMPTPSPRSASALQLEIQTERSNEPPSLGSFLDPDGTLVIPEGFSGPIDPAGFQLDAATDGGPRFRPGAGVAAAPGSDANWSGAFPLTGLDSTVNAVVVTGTAPNAVVYLGGDFRSAGNQPANRIVRFDQASGTWHPLGFGLDSGVKALALNGTTLYVGGYFSRRCLNADCSETANAEGLNHIAAYDTVTGTWFGLANGLDRQVETLLFANGHLVAGGTFREQCLDLACSTETISSGFNRIARWDGAAWRKLGFGLNYDVLALAYRTTDNRLYVGGRFDRRCLSGSCSIGADEGIHFVGSYLDPFANENETWAALGNGVRHDIYFGGVRALGFNPGEGRIWLGGEFNEACDNATCSTATDISKNVVRYDFSAASWLNAEFGLNGVVEEFLYFDGKMHLGGGFGRACTMLGPACTETAYEGLGGVARYDAASNNFEALGNGVDGNPYALVAAPGSVVLLVGGAFGQACGASVDCSFAGGRQLGNAAAWAPGAGTWSPLGPEGNSPGNMVTSLVVEGDDVYLGGSFGRIGALAANRVARWNRSTGTWSAVGFGLNQTVWALAWHNGQLHAGGYFTKRCADANCSTTDLDLHRVARWDGAAWQPLGNGLNSIVYALASNGPTLYLGGSFTLACADATCTTTRLPGLNRVALWNGVDYATLGNGVNYTVYALADDGPTVYAGGVFTGLCNDPACTSNSQTGVNRVARWTGSAWEPLAFGLAYDVRALTIYSGQLWAGGGLDYVCTNASCSTYSQTGVNGIARWDGAAWQPAGFGFDEGVKAMLPLGGALFVGGDFANLCPDAACSSIGPSMAGIARWDPSVNAWAPLGSGVYGRSQYDAIRALAAITGTLVAGGTFGVAGGKAAGRFATFGQVADAAVGPSGAPNPVLPGGQITYTATISNNGPAIAFGVIMTATLDSATAFVSVTSSQGVCGGTTTIVCLIGPLPSGGSATVRVRVGTTVGPTNVLASFAVASLTVDPLLGNDRGDVGTDLATATPTAPPGSTATPTVPPGSTATPTRTSTATRTPTPAGPPGSTATPTLTPVPTRTPTFGPSGALWYWLGGITLNAPLG
ncbi:MAG: hypothetical protein U0556_11410 [Dehalococcoidia bacterium]